MERNILAWVPRRNYGSSRRRGVADGLFEWPLVLALQVSLRYKRTPRTGPIWRAIGRREGRYGACTTVSAPVQLPCRYYMRTPPIPLSSYQQAVLLRSLPTSPPSLPAASHPHRGRVLPLPRFDGTLTCQVGTFSFTRRLFRPPTTVRYFQPQAASCLFPSVCFCSPPPPSSQTT